MLCRIVGTDILQEHTASICRKTDYESSGFWSTWEEKMCFITYICPSEFPSVGSEKSCTWNSQFQWPKFPKTFLYSQHIPLASYCSIHLNKNQSLWRWRHIFSLKCQNIHVHVLYGVTTQKRTIKWKNNCHEKLKTHIGHPLNELYICTCPSP